MQLMTAVEEGMTVLEIQADNIFVFPDGIPAFESVKEFVILSNPEEAPLMWLQATGRTDPAFIVTMPAVFHPNYVVDISDEDVEFLGLASPEDALVLSIITVRRGDPIRVTANLAGPVVINPKKGVGKQVIPLNAGEYSVRHDVFGELRKLRREEVG